MVRNKKANGGRKAAEEDKRIAKNVHRGLSMPAISAKNYQQMADRQSGAVQLLAEPGGDSPQLESVSEDVRQMLRNLPDRENTDSMGTGVLQGIFLSQSNQNVDENNVAALKKALKGLSKKKHKKDIALVKKAIKALKTGKKKVSAMEVKADVQVEAAPAELDPEALAIIGPLNMSRSKVAAFAALCEGDQVDPEMVLRLIAHSPTSGLFAPTVTLPAMVAGVTAFINGGPLGTCTIVSQHYDEMMTMDMKHVTSQNLAALINAGALTVHANPYKHNVMHAGTAYTFWIPYLNKRIRAEWHAHWGSKNAVNAGSFKNNARAFGQGARVDTKGDDHKTLQQAIGSLWGAGKRS